ncbi:MAG: beta-lactamase family protein [Fimbriimonadaceae bacterium]|nr:beta-lactamase family protein [Fimbriimonadaceae bacterium]QYK59589.1 MAG: beta-lactamase family protein [Fimbriimonadaceae bacterium]
MNGHLVVDLLEDGVARGVFPGAAFAWGGPVGCEQVFVGRLWGAADAPAVGPDTLFDIASLTKPLGVTPVVRALVDAGLGALDEPLGDSVPGCWGLQMSISDLLAHTSGLPPYMEEPWRLGGPPGIWEVVARLAESAVPTEQAVYSCLGFVVLKHWAEAVSPEPFEVLVGRAAPGLMYNPPEPDRQRAAPTGPAPTWRGGDEWIQGQVHDPIAWLLGGVSGNAGLFGDLGSVTSVVQQAWRAPAIWKKPVRESGRALGWDLVPPYLYHYGFTGCAAWIHAGTGRFAVLLTNHVHMGGDRLGYIEFRRAVESLLMKHP